MPENAPEHISTEDVLNALEKVLSSKEFEGAGRLKEFLTYVVRESLDGRGHMILGKRIAEDVYGRPMERDNGTANVVRVDAGRLRRRLDGYYLDEGRTNPVRIHIDKGGYSPRFSYVAAQEDQPNQNEGEQSTSNPMRMTFVFTVLAVVAAATLGVFIWLSEPQVVQPSALSPQPINSDRRTERGVLFEQSPASLQALNLAEEARLMMFPATQPARLQAALTLFEEAIDLDPSYYGGYAGAAQASAMFGGLAPLGETRDQMMARSRSYAETSVKLNPTAAWSQSALAYVNMFERNFEEANRLSRRAVSLDPEDLVTLEIDAIIAFFSGDFERARQSAAPERHKNRPGSRFPWRNVYGNASFYLEEYKVAVDFLLSAAENGEPVSEISTAHLIASLQSINRKREAKRYLDEYVSTWPDSRIEEFMYRLFQNPANAQKLVAKLKEAGWQN